jgi:hypothetical protein
MAAAVGAQGLMLFAVSAFALASTHGRPSSAALLAVIGFMLLMVSPQAGKGSIPLLRTSGTAALVTIVLGWGTPAMEYPETGLATLALWMGGPLFGSIAMIFASQSRRARGLAAVAVAASVAFVTVGIMVEYQGSLTGTDVYLFHVAAAGALESGVDPYSDAITVPDGSPYAAAGSVIRGYPYPPVTLSAYAGATLALGDPRWASALAWLMVVGSLAWRGGAREREQALAALLVLGASPSWRMVEFSAWTEPITLLLFAIVAYGWERGPHVAGFVLGLALASKQYTVVMIGAVAVIVARVGQDLSHRRRSIGLMLGGLVGLAPVLLGSVESFVDSAVVTPATIPFRPDSQSLSGLVNELGLEFVLPSWLALVAAIGVAVAVRNHLWTGSGLLYVAAASLSCLFLLSMAFPNYWFLVMALTALSVGIPSAEPAEVSNALSPLR